MKIKVKNFIWLSISIIFVMVNYFIIQVYIDNNYSFENVISCFTVVTVVSVIFQLYALKKVGYRLLSPICLFLIFCYVFHFGQVVMQFNYDYDYVNYLSTYMKNIDVLKDTLKACSNGINFTFFGAVVAKTFQNERSETKQIDVAFEREICFKVGIALFAISTPIRLYIDGIQLRASMINGYSGAIGAVSWSGVFAAIAGFWYSSLILIYIGKNNKKILWIGMAYTALTMLTGNRGHQITNLIVLAVVYIYNEKISFSIGNIFKYGFLIYVMLVFVDVIMSFRSVGVKAFFSDFAYYLLKSLKSNILFETIGSFGETVFTPYLVLIKLKGYDAPPYFNAWLNGFVTLFPNIGGLTTAANEASNYPKMLRSAHAIGGSYIGDMLYNAQGAYCVFASIAGFFIGKVSNKLKEAIENCNYSKLLWIIPVFYNCNWWVRDSLGNEMRQIVWQILFSYSFLVFLKKRK